MRRFVKFLVAAVAVGFVLATIFALYIYQYGQTDQAAPADVIVVLGAGTLRNGMASPATARRTLHAVALYQRGLAPLIICTGDVTSPSPKSEARACADLAEREGVPASAILLDERSTSTEENAIETRKIMDAHGLKMALLVTDNFHMLRAEMMFHIHGIDVMCSPAQATTEPLDGWRAAFNTYREVGAFGWYALKSVLGLPSTSTKF